MWAFDSRSRGDSRRSEEAVWQGPTTISSHGCVAAAYPPRCAFEEVSGPFENDSQSCNCREARLSGDESQVPGDGIERVALVS